MSAIDWSAPSPILASQQVGWGPKIVLQQSLIATSAAPPRDLVTSVRAVIVHGASILVLSDRNDAHHVVPGGRVEPGETWHETVHREVLEETGLTIDVTCQFAVIASAHQTPKSFDYRYPYPTFYQAVYLAYARNPAQLHIDDEWVADGMFVPIPEALDLKLPPIQASLATLAASHLGLIPYQPQPSFDPFSEPEFHRRSPIDPA